MSKGECNPIDAIERKVNWAVKIIKEKSEKDLDDSEARTIAYDILTYWILLNFASQRKEEIDKISKEYGIDKDEIIKDIEKWKDYLIEH